MAEEAAQNAPTAANEPNDESTTQQQFETLLRDKEEEIMSKNVEIVTLKDLHKGEIARLKNQLEESESINAELQSKVMEQDTMITELKHYAQVIEEAKETSARTKEKKWEEESLNEEKATFREKIRSLELTISQQQNDLLKREMTVAVLENNMIHKDNKIGELQKEIENKNRKLESRKFEKKELQNRVTQMQNELMKKEVSVMFIDSEIKRKTETLDEMKEKAESRENELKAAEAERKRTEKELHQKELEKVKQEAEGKVLPAKQEVELKLLRDAKKEAESRCEKLMESFSHFASAGPASIGYGLSAPRRLEALPITQGRKPSKPKRLPQIIGAIFYPKGKPGVHQEFEGPTKNHEDLEGFLEEIFTQHNTLIQTIPMPTEQRRLEVIHNAGYSILAPNFKTDWWMNIESFDDIVELWEENSEDQKIFTLFIVHHEEQRDRWNDALSKLKN